MTVEEAANRLNTNVAGIVNLTLLGRLTCEGNNTISRESVERVWRSMVHNHN